ncbi:hypothetical protein BABINDRAFT_158964 [Babjeviella inositovora NRRL Y-12698]|uniref:Uncharacterized protein n=1 Tax=Babjeviella inositovora NRRL Y-12698 TaxID=984486 RepID=A0A1E3QZ34_9ASCO|nr:uncharacterized protein BABINDRAFT_158964 [Babjeviella inositovora NRRL Y-12698]ODQ82347.1 hypothetical protein BABINDRAFT_158964 [Babjeviella inositovora NRRL Y-12698]
MTSGYMLRITVIRWVRRQTAGLRMYPLCLFTQAEKGSGACWAGESSAPKYTSFSYCDISSINLIRYNALL